jgi:cytochrome c oxidase subunit II
MQVSPTNIFAPASTPAESIFGVSMFVLLNVGAIFVVVFALLAYAAVRFRHKPGDDRSEPAQVYGSSQVELAWTVIPALIVMALLLAGVRGIASIQNSQRPPGALEVIVTGHQYWWEYRYPGLNIVTANELHVPVSDPAHPTPTFLTLLSADTDHSFWVPRLAGKTDLIPNHPNSMWIDPHEPGLFLGQCAQYCGTQHAKMLLRVYVQPGAEFERWVRQQQQAAHVSAPATAASNGQRVFESMACVNCHAVSATPAKGQFGPDLTHLMSRETIAAGAAPNTPQMLRLWIRNPDAIKPGSKMPAMGLSEQDVDAVATYLESLH